MGAEGRALEVVWGDREAGGEVVADQAEVGDLLVGQFSAGVSLLL